MKNLDFEWLTDEFMLYCRSTQLREKTMSSYEQTLHLFGRWLSDELKIYTVDRGTKLISGTCRNKGKQFRSPNIHERLWRGILDHTM